MKSNSNTQPTCEHAHYHLTPQEHCLWDISRAWSSKSGILYFDGTKLSKQYQSWSRSQVYKLRDSLIAKGWFQELKKPRKTGNDWTAGSYCVLAHDEYVAKHGAGACPEIDSEGIVKVSKKAKFGVHLEDKKPVHGKTVVSTMETSVSTMETAGVHYGDNRCPPRGTKLVVSALKACKEAGKPAAGFSTLFSRLEGGTDSSLLEERPVSARVHSEVHHQKTGVHLEVHRGTILWDSHEQRYTDSITGKDVWKDEINERIAPNTFSGSAFLDPSGKTITLEQAQVKELACQ